MISRYWQEWTATVVAILALGCAESVPRGAYEVNSLEIRGTERVDPENIAACLATHPRERWGFVLFGEGVPRCGVPPFQTSGVAVEPWVWPWTDRSVFSAPAFHRDLSRIERFYRARGYYEARVVASDVVRDAEDREVDITITVSEGAPVLIVRIRIEGLERVPEDLVEEVRDAVTLELGAPFDEALYDATRRRILDVLYEGSYAKATVTGRVAIDPHQRIARVELTVEPGPPCRFGRVRVEGHGALPVRPILGAAQIEADAPFRLSTLNDAQRAIYELGPFASVEIERLPRQDAPVVDLVIRVVPARAFRFAVGVGMEAGGINAQDQSETAGDSFAQWDVHLLGRIEHRNFLGDMRRLRVEDRPRLIFDDPFPKTGSSNPGNLLLTELRQPAFIESRTTLVARTRWDRGPDPFGGKFLRHDVGLGAGPERRFLGGKLLLGSSINLDLFMPDNADPYPNYNLAYFRHRAALDLRDNPRRPRSGAYFTLVGMHAGYFLPSAWDLVRITQDNRAYVPLPFGVVLAARARFGLMHVAGTSIDVPPFAPADDSTAAADVMRTRILLVDDLARFGPVQHRLRGGGQNSVRGYAPNTLGDVQIISDGRVDRLLSGGLRQWEGSLELRIPITESLGTALFLDAGDVSRSTSWRFDRPQTSFGAGVRYHTLVGPLRLDAAIAPKELQVVGTDDRLRTGVQEVDGFLVSFTIGEAF